MKTVIFCNRLGGLKKYFAATDKDTDQPLRFLNLRDDEESFLICQYLKDHTQSEEIPRATLLRERSKEFRESYTEFIGQINHSNSSLNWWAMSFTNKDPFSTPLMSNVAHFLLIVSIVRSSQTNLLVISDSTDLAAQVNQWAKQDDLASLDIIKRPRPFRNFFKRHTPVGTVKAAFRIFALWFQSRRFKPTQDQANDYNVITTHTHTQSFIEPNSYKDVYFGPLLDHATKSGSSAKTLILGLVLEQPREQFRKLKALQFDLPVIPLESCLTLRDLAATVLQSIKLYLKPTRLHGPAVIDGVDVSYLVTEAIRNSRDSGEFLINLHVYYCARWLSKTVRISRCLYPFENRAWEKMLITGIRDGAPEARISGYQHTSITMGHTNFMLGFTEAKTMPLPNGILTTGQITKDWLEQNGNYPPDFFQSACALRQIPEFNPPPKKRPNSIKNVLVALATSMDEYVNTLLFLERAFAGQEGFELRIRPHPSLMSLEPALAITPMKNRDFFNESTGSIDDALDWADVVLYSSSTVCLEAISKGIPAIYVDLGFHVDTDPMFDWSKFKWRVKDPGELAQAFHDIEDLSNDGFSELQMEGREYTESYLRPVTEERMSVFWNG
jgi:surface carbohydrate biosynthesis protein (TIGR04326 family)